MRKQIADRQVIFLSFNLMVGKLSLYLPLKITQALIFISYFTKLELLKNTHLICRTFLRRIQHILCRSCGVILKNLRNNRLFITRPIKISHFAETCMRTYKIRHFFFSVQYLCRCLIFMRYMGYTFNIYSLDGLETQVGTLFVSTF